MTIFPPLAIRLTSTAALAVATVLCLAVPFGATAQAAQPAAAAAAPATTPASKPAPVPKDGKGALPDPELAQKIADHFSSVKTMLGEFVQFGPKGEQTGGKFYIERPGKLRFNYDQPSPMRVIADGTSVAIGNIKLSTWDLYPLSKTPLSLLLSDKIDLRGDMVRSVKVEPDLTTVVLGDSTIFGDSTITMMFDSKTYDLRQWTITDPQAKETAVMIFNIQTGVDLDKRVFAIPYDTIHSSAKQH